MNVLFFNSLTCHSYFLFYILLNKGRVALFEKPQREEENLHDEKDAKSSPRPRNRSTLIESKFLLY